MSESNPDGLEAFATLGRYLAEDGWFPQEVPNHTAYRMRYQGHNGDLRVFAQIRVDAEQLIIYAIAPNNVPEEARAGVAEYLTRANYGMYIGNFELDYNDGEVRFKSSVDFEDVSLDPKLIRNTIYPAVRLMDKYLPGLLKVAYGGKSPLEAVSEIETPPPA
jgi:hypothetical protein